MDGINGHIMYDVLEPISKRKLGYFVINYMDSMAKSYGGYIALVSEYDSGITLSPMNFYQYLFVLRFMGKNDTFVKLWGDVPYSQSLMTNMDGTVSGNITMKILDNLDALNELETLRKIKQAASE